MSVKTITAKIPGTGAKYASTYGPNPKTGKQTSQNTKYAGKK